jgi:invasion protein IalB
MSCAMHHWLGGVIIEMENRNKLIELQDQFDGKQGDLVAPHRIFVKKGILTKICRSKDKKVCLHHCIHYL